MVKRRSPIKEKPLRLPGQSIDTEIDKLQNDKMLFLIMYSVTLFSLSIFVWTLWITKILLPPYLITFATIIVIIYSAIQVIRIRHKVDLLILGRDGERIVAETLDDLRKDGAAIFHDILGKDFNLDHVIICTHGIFVIETKTRSKFSDSKVFYDGKVLLVDGMRPDRDPLVQVNAEVSWLREQLQASTGKKFPIRPVVVFPGWYVETTKEANRSDVWVLNPKGVPTFVRNEAPKISEEDVRLAAFALACMVRNGG
jgi:hypothetical protein